MIQASEVRIGNWVKLKFNPKYPATKLEITVKSIDYDFLLHAEYYINGDFLHEIDPIPLTPEILEKVGFEKLGVEEDDIFYRLPFGYLLGKQLTISGYFEFDGKFITHGKPEIKYVHTLQNLYFALTGTELTIEL
jgi:hypothetical protein